MPMPDELSGFDDEKGFVQRFLIPLLRRLGFSIVINYHGRREFGKDIIFGEIDRFSHVRYHGLQAKYTSSVGKAAAHDLTQDCDEAFAKDFTHPQTGQQHSISSFYAVNAGSISDEARDLFFATLRPKHGDNVRLIDGKDLLGLDRSAVISRAESGRELLVGLLIEATYNEDVLERVIPCLGSIAKGDGHNVQYPPLRLRVNAAAFYLQRPFLVSELPVEVIERFWSMGSVFNRALDEAGSSPLHTVVSIKVPAAKALQLIPQLAKDVPALKEALGDALTKLGPIAGV